MTSAADTRASAAIAGYVGPNGSGKSLLCALDTMPSLDEGRPVLSTMRFLDWRNPRSCDDLACECDKADVGRHGAAHPAYIPWTSWDQLMDFTFGDVIADEIMGVASSRETSDLPKRVAARLNELRRWDICLRFTGPAWARADLVIRECCQLVTVCSGSFKVPAEDGRRKWRRSRLVKATSYDVTEVVDFRVQSRQDMTRAARQWVWIPKSDARLAFDTLAPVFKVGASDQGGRCDDCHKRIRAEYCKCDHQPSEQGLRASGRGELASATETAVLAEPVPAGSDGLDGGVSPRRLLASSSLLDTVRLSNVVELNGRRPL